MQKVSGKFLSTNMRRMAAILLASTAMAGGAYAADMPQPSVPVVPVGYAYDWSGFYISAGLGAGAAVHELDALGLLNFNGLGGEGVFGEIGVGYDFMLSDRVLLGIYGDFRFGNIETSLNVGPFGGDVTLDYGFDIIGRLGYVLSPHTLAYLLAGYSHQHFDLSSTVGFAYDWDAGGFVVGAGIETVLSGNWTLKGEYRYADYGSDDFGTGGLINVTPSTHTFLAAISYRFGANRGGGAPIAPINHEWNGFYVSAGVGAGAVNHDVSALGLLNLSGIGGEGIYGELGIGYDRLLTDRVLLGIYGDVRFGNIETALNVGPFGGAISLDTGFDIIARLGYLVTPETLAYVLAGYTHQDFELTSNIGFGLGWDAGGFVVGGGLETALNDLWSVKAEYRYASYGDGLGLAGLFSVEPDTHTVTVGVSRKFLTGF